MSRTDRLRRAWPSLIFLAIAIAVHAPAWINPSRRAFCGCGDLAFAAWFFSWTPYAVLHGHNPLITDWLNHPDGVNVMWNVSLPLPGLLMTPVTLAFGPVATYNVLSAVAFWTAGWAAYAVIRRWAPWRPAAFVGGLLFQLSPFMMGQQLGHVHMNLLGLVPLMLLCLDELLVRQSGRAWLWGGLLGALAAAQLLTAEEVLASAALIGLVGLLVLVLLHPRRLTAKIRYAGTGALAAVVSFAALGGYPLYVEFFGPQALHGAVQLTDRFSVDLLEAVVPSRRVWLRNEATNEVAARFTGNLSENGAYLGITLIVAVLLVLLVYRRVATVRALSALLLATFVLSLGSHLHVNGRVKDIALPFGAVQHLPLLESVTPTRLALFTSLFAGALLAIGLDRLHARLGVGALSRLLPTGLALLALLPLAPQFAWDYYDTKVPAYYRSAAVARIPEGSVALMVPFPNRVDSRPELWQATTGMRFKSPGGYVLTPGSNGRPTFGGVPSPLSGALRRIVLGRPLPRSTPAFLRQLRGDLRRWQIRTVIVTEHDRMDQTLALLTLVLHRPPIRDQGAFAWYDVDPAAL